MNSQTSHLNGFFLSWIEVIRIFKEVYLLKKAPSQRLQLNGFSFLWTSLMCFLREQFIAKLKSQESHLNGFFPSWTAEICTAKFDLVAKFELKIWQLNFLILLDSLLLFWGFILSWTGAQFTTELSSVFFSSNSSLG